MSRRAPQPFTVIGRRPGGPPVRIGVIAHNLAEAITTARELFPTYLVTTASLSPEWEDAPA